MKNTNHKKQIGKLITLIIIIIFLVESLIMLAFELLNINLGGFYLALLDSTLLAVISSPIIFFLIIKPYVEIIVKRESELSYLASYDHLTGLLNRRALILELKSAVEQCKRTQYFGALFYLDLDGFKPINDKFGHEVGDAVLCHVAEKIEEATRINDICARVGGDEFIVICPLLDKDKLQLKEKAEAIAKKISSSIENSEAHPEIEDIGASIGIVFLSEYEDVDTLIKKADEAMYAAKKTKKLYQFGD